MTGPRSTWALGIALALSVAGATREAYGQSSTALAEKLFREGKALMDQKNYKEACPKFAESNRLDPGSGTLIALGACDEADGKLASAWGAYTEAVSAARRDNNPKREKAAAERAKKLEPKLSHVTFRVAASTAALDGLLVKQDGVEIGSAAWDKAPIDPGEHTLEVTAAKKQRWSTTFTVGAESDDETVDVPELADVPVAPVAPESTPIPPSKIAGFVLGGVGAVSVITGAILGGLAIAASDDAKSKCTPQLCTDPAVVDENDRAKTFADVSTVTMILGAVTLAAGVVFIFAAPKPKTESKVVTYLAPTLGGAMFGGVF